MAGAGRDGQPPGEEIPGDRGDERRGDELLGGNCGGNDPRPTVLATAVPDTAPTTLRIAAMLTAWPGERTRVATDVAMALAVS